MVLVLDLMALFQGLILGIILLFPKQSEKSSFFLGLFLITYALEFTPSLIFRIWDDIAINYTFLPLYFYFLNVPLLYIYIKKLIGDYSMKNLTHLIIPGLIEFVLLSTLFLGAKTKFISFLKIAEITSYFYIFQLIALIFSIVFSIVTIRLILKYQKRAANYYSRIDGRILQWLNHLSIFLIIYNVVLILIIILPTFINIDFSLIKLLLGLINVIFIYWVALSGYKQSLRPMVIMTSIDYEPEVQDKNIDSVLFTDIVNYFKTEKPFTNPDFNIQLLALEMKIPYKKVSKVINESTNENFNTFVNKFRVEQVKSMLIVENFNHYSIESIGFEAGFNSKASFYSAFKKFTGTTPSLFKRNIIN